ncbi:CBS domain-containing protein [Betaproteobacteria bacterium SCN1]|jgi:CBS domain-containing protein|nr:CBS domain-containing protein [Betaproteobacteria bacterium SCN1]MBN8761307.1 CBS domain-containing protein [Thiobacillus sp.]ODU88404.1 MAG: CBS domain-containing protein [Thiobacillus sp. SCN 65-179]OJW36513.1 MAG: CBS domain-containing protein [Thiobacillus sp. 65-69]
MQIREILTLKPATIHSIAPTDAVSIALGKMVELGVGSLVVMRNEEMVGLLTERDVVHGLVRQGCDLKDAQVSTIMVTEPVVANAEDSVDYARDVMTKSHIGHLPIFDGNRLLGIISFHDVARACLKEANFENSLLKRYIKHWPE